MGMHTDELYFKPRLQVINTRQIQQIHMATLEVLERTGIKLTHPKALELLSGGGARVDGDRVRIPSWMVEDAIREPEKEVLPLNGTNPILAPAWTALIIWIPQPIVDAGLRAGMWKSRQPCVMHFRHLTGA